MQLNHLVGFLASNIEGKEWENPVKQYLYPYMRLQTPLKTMQMHCVEAGLLSIDMCLTHFVFLQMFCPSHHLSQLQSRPQGRKTKMSFKDEI